MNKFSIIVPVYNSYEYLDKCISSIINQNYSNIEIIIVNDGSTDDSYIKCQQYGNIDSRIKLIDKPNGGVSSSRNIGISNASGNYIVFVDSDDYLDVNAISTYNNLIDSTYDFDIIISELLVDSHPIYSSKIINTVFSLKSLFYKLSKNYRLIEKINSVIGKVYNTDIINSHNLVFDENINIGEDLLFNISYFNYCNNILWTNTSFYHYCTHNPNSLTKKFIYNKYEQLLIVNDEFKCLLLKFGDLSLLNIQKYSKLKNIYSCFMDLYNYNCQFTYAQKVTYIKKVRENTGTLIIKKPFIFLILSIFYSFLPVTLLILLIKCMSTFKRIKFYSQ